MVSPQKYKVKFVQREREEEKRITKYEVRWERAIYSQDGKSISGISVVESEVFDNEKEAQDLWDGWEIKETGEILYFDEIEIKEGYVETVENYMSKGNFPEQID